MCSGCGGSGAPVIALSGEFHDPSMFFLKNATEDGNLQEEWK
jgi:hypothetical protein